jgi:hypothetical protein
VASDVPDIDPGDGETGGGLPEAAAAAAAACLACGAAIVGPFCAACGQKNDDMRRSSFILFKDFLKDTFAFDSRMWRTLGLMAAAPGLVPTSYSHGRRSRYTPPVRLFLVVSFLFFLTLGLTQTLFVAFDVTPKSAAQIAAEKQRFEEAMRRAGPDAREAIEAARKSAAGEELLVVDGEAVSCDIDVRTRFFVRPKDLKFDEQRWRACSESISERAKAEIAGPEGAQEDFAGEGPTEEDVAQGFEKALAGVNRMVANPVAFNAEINEWLPRVMFLMAPVLALILALFIRGRDALLFDHLVFSLYGHAAGFAVIGTAIILGQFGAPFVFPAAMTALGAYYLIALKRAYRRGWVKTAYSAAFSGVLYAVILSSVVGFIIFREIWETA